MSRLTWALALCAGAAALLGALALPATAGAGTGAGGEVLADNHIWDADIH
ncbi:hypothetical protein [Streptomyces sp. SBT349]|nr:hypothetical protein [Streptomyces sp. SBT349]